MSGHSKWATTKRQKFAADAKRSSAFTRLARAITMAAQELGGDVDTNFKLRLAIDKAKAVNMPKDNIERAIKRGTGEADGQQIAAVVYEAFGPGGSAFIIETLTDNRNRTVADIKHILNKHEGSLGGPNSVAWMFSKRGVIDITNATDPEAVELAAIEAGADDVQANDDTVTVFTDLSKLQAVKKKLEDGGLAVAEVTIAMIPNEPLHLDAGAESQAKELYDALTDSEDVNDIYTNIAGA